MLYGFSGVILQGALVTLELAISSVVLAVIIGLIGAGGKLSQNRLSGLIFEGYTTLIRGVPDLVLMLLIFYGLQIALNTVTEAMGVGQIDIDPMVAGIITLGFIYGAYFTETFRGAFMAVPKGHIEAATAFGFTRGQVFRRIMFPSMMRYALPGIGNNWQVILKSTALVSLLGLEDVVKATQLAGKSTWEPFYFAIVCGVIYLVFTTVSNGVLLFLERLPDLRGYALDKPPELFIFLFQHEDFHLLLYALFAVDLLLQALVLLRQIVDGGLILLHLSQVLVQP